MRVSRYDQVASWIVSMLILVGISVVTLVIMVLSARIFARPEPQVFKAQQIAERGLGVGEELESPDIEGTDMEEPELEETLAAIADAVGTQLATLDDPTFTSRSRPGSGVEGSGRGGQPGPISGRQWEVRFPEGNTTDSYARQLDFFGIELAVVMPDGTLEYAAQLSRAKPARRVGAAEQEMRFYLTWRRGELQEADRELLSKAGINSEGKLILKFLPPATEAMLAQLERDYAGLRADKVRGTRFAVRPRGNGFTFEVISQWYWQFE